MLSTNTVKLTAEGKPKKLRVLMSAGKTGGAFNLDAKRYPDVKKRPTRKAEGHLFSSDLSDIAAGRARRVARRQGKR
jgi:hypothetical protein